MNTKFVAACFAPWVVVLAVFFWDKVLRDRPKQATGETGYYSSPNVTRPAASVGGYTQCRLILASPEGKVIYDKVTYCYSL